MVIVEVHWIDAMGEPEDFKHGDKHEFCRRVTIGYFVEETDDGVVLATDYYKSLEGRQEFYHRMTIPYGVIESWHEIAT